MPQYLLYVVIDIRLRSLSIYIVIDKIFNIYEGRRGGGVGLRRLFSKGGG